MTPSLPNSQFSNPHAAKCRHNSNLCWYWRCSLDSVIAYAVYHITLKIICAWGKIDLLSRWGNRLRKAKMTHPRPYSCCLGFAMHKQPCGWLMDSAPTGGLFILLSGLVWLSRVLHLQIPDTCLAPSNQVPGPGRRAPWQWSRPCAPPLPLLWPLCYFSDDQRRQGLWKGVELYQYILLLRSNRSRGAGKKPVANDGFISSGAELPHPSTRVKPEASLSASGGDRLVRM